MAITAAGVAAAASAVSAVGGIFGASAQRRFNAREAQKARDFQERMSSSAYQRSMADMRLAGLNPILAYQQGGSSTPSGAMAHGSPNLGEAFAKGGLMGAQLGQVLAGTAKTKAETKLIEANTPKAETAAEVWSTARDALRGGKKLTIETWNNFRNSPQGKAHIKKFGLPYATRHRRN